MVRFWVGVSAAAVLAASFALPSGASAQPVTGPYVSAGAGLNILDHRKLDRITLQDGPSLRAGGHEMFHNGYDVTGSVGYGFGNGFRVELEGNYADNGLKKRDTIRNTQIPVSGSEKKYGAMANVLYDFDIGSPFIYPYVGVGAGYQFGRLRDDSVPFYPGGPDALRIDDNGGSFAYQGLVGLSLPIPYVRGLSATLQYSYMRLTHAAKYQGVYGYRDATYKFSGESNNTFSVGLRYEFFTPAPPPLAAPTPTPVSAPAPAQARTYLVFFDWNKANLSPRATQIVGEAAHASQTTHVTQLKVDGYTDTSGLASYNEKLSYRRADNVAARLVTDGVPKGDIVIKGYGETHLLVATGPGVREPQNRRVEIILQ